MIKEENMRIAYFLLFITLLYTHQLIFSMEHDPLLSGQNPRNYTQETNASDRDLEKGERATELVELGRGRTDDNNLIQRLYSITREIQKKEIEDLERNKFDFKMSSGIYSCTSIILLGLTEYDLYNFTEQDYEHPILVGILALGFPGLLTLGSTGCAIYYFKAFNKIKRTIQQLKATLESNQEE